MNRLTLILPIALLPGCATNPFTQFYQDYTATWPIAQREKLLPASHEPQVFSTSVDRHLADSRQLQERGYVAIGFAGFQGGAPTKAQLIQQAKIVGAEIVLYASQFSHTEEGVLPLLSYQPGTTSTTTQFGTINSSTSGSGGSAYGSGTYSGSSITTTPGTFGTQYLPYQRTVYEFDASFWRRRKPFIFGAARLEPLTDTMRATLQRNSGALVVVVVQDSPAFKANILPGDVIIQIADKEVSTPQAFTALIESYAGQKVRITLIRGTKTLEIEVQLNESQ